METLGPITWETLGLGGLAFMVIIAVLRMMFTGKWVPEAQVERLLADARDRIEHLESALSKRDDTIAALVEQVAKLTVQGDISVRVLQALPQPGSSHVASPQD